MTREELTNKTVAELRQMCVHELEIPGMTKKRKDVIIDVILKKTKTKTKTITIQDPNVESIEGTFSSQLTTPGAKFGNKATTTIRVSAGASSGDFPVVGKTVGAVSEFLREVLNVARMSRGIVNGNKVEDNYVLKAGDILEYLKPAGSKGLKAIINH